jgi:hypothetical protein
MVVDGVILYGFATLAASRQAEDLKRTTTT